MTLDPRFYRVTHQPCNRHWHCAPALIIWGHKKTKTARVWTYVRDERPWSGQSPPYAWYQFTIDRKGEHPENHLAGCKGLVHADGYSGFNGLFGHDKADEMACMAHVRRKFVDIFASQGNAIAEEAIVGSRSSTPWRKRRGAKQAMNVLLCGSCDQNRSSMIWKPGCMPNSPKSLASRRWPRPFVMLLAGCQRRCHTLSMAIWNWITTQRNAPSNLLPLAGKIGCSRVPRAAEKQWQSPTP